MTKLPKFKYETCVGLILAMIIVHFYLPKFQFTAQYLTEMTIYGFAGGIGVAIGYLSYKKIKKVNT